MSEIEVPEVLPKNEYLKLPISERELYVREILRQTVKKNLHGVTASNLAQKLPFDSRTIEKHLSVLTCTNEIYAVKIGNTPLYLPNSIPMHHAKKQTLQLRTENMLRTFSRTEWVNLFFIQEKKKTKFTEEIGGGILVPLTDFQEFVNFISTFNKDINTPKKSP